MLKVSKNQLLEELRKVIKVVPSKTSVAVASGFLIEANNGNMKITGTNLEMAIETTLPYETQLGVEVDEDYIIDARMFHDIISKLSSDDVELSLSDNNLNIKSGKAKFSIITLGKKDIFPLAKKDDASYEINVKGRILKELILKTIPFTGDDETRPILGGVNLEFSDNALVGVSLDGYRMSYYTNAIENNKTTSIVVPAAVLVHVGKLISGEEDVKVIIGKNKTIQLIFKNCVITAKQYDGQFVNYKQLLNTENYKTKIKVDVEEFKSAIDRTIVLAKTSKGFASLVLTLSDDMLELNVNSEIGVVKEQLKVEVEGEKNDFKIAFNPKFLQEGLNVIEEESIEFRFNTAITPAYITGEKGYTYMILPVRLAS